MTKIADVSQHNAPMHKIAPRNNAQQEQNERCSFFQVPPLVANSTLVRQRASANTSLAAASLQAAAMPLMIGGRSRCVLNIIGGGQEAAGERKTSPTGGHPHQQHVVASVPKNTALRAEQRKHTNAVSVVRPTMKNSGYRLSPPTSEITSREFTMLGKLNTSSNSNAWLPTYDSLDDLRTIRYNPEEPKSTAAVVNTATNLLDELMSIDAKAAARRSHPQLNFMTAHTTLPVAQQSNMNTSLRNEQHMRQQAALARREEHELSRHVRRQHKYFMDKIGERKRNLLVVQNVWACKDFKSALEKMLDIYHDGFVFKPTIDASDGGYESLRPTNTTLVTDIIDLLTMRPKLWTLEVCQILLPIIVDDLLKRNLHDNAKTVLSDGTNCAEHQIVIASRALRLILTQFTQIITSTLDTERQTAKFTPVGIDLSREDRLQKCIACYKLLCEAKALLFCSAGGSRTCPAMSSNLPVFKELQQLFSQFSSKL